VVSIRTTCCNLKKLDILLHTEIMSFISLQRQQRLIPLTTLTVWSLQCTRDVFSVRKKMNFCITSNLCDAHRKVFSNQFTRKECLTKHIRYYNLTLSHTLYLGSISKYKSSFKQDSLCPKKLTSRRVRSITVAVKKQ
jgi:hypothetical protein